jgi:hypothetical protein
LRRMEMTQSSSFFSQPIVCGALLSGDLHSSH